MTKKSIFHFKTSDFYLISFPIRGDFCYLVSDNFKTLCTGGMYQMAGHSKWANIKHKKGREDAKRGKV